MNDTNPRLRNALVVVGGLIIAIVLTLIVLLFTAGDGQSAAITDVPAASTTTTTIAASTTTVEATTTTTAPASTTTTAVTTTTTTIPSSTTTEGPADPSGFDTDTKTSESSGEPGSALTGVRTGDHTTFTRVVFDFEGDGTPRYEVGYESGPTFNGSGGDPIAPDGAAFLVVRIVPGLTYDIDDFSPTYLGPTSFDPGLGAIVEIVFVNDVTARMVWVIGLRDTKGFQVSTRLDPQRVVIDIAN